MLSAKTRMQLDVSRETEERLAIYVETLLRWNKKINLIGRTTADQVWERHILDSAQLNSLTPRAKRWVDLGAGAGLPAIVIAAIRQIDEPQFEMSVIESDQRKCAFMAEVSRKMGTPLQIINSRIENVRQYGFDTVSARALAPLSKLLSYAAPFRAESAICLFPKGVRVDQELTEASRDWHMTYEKIQSATDSASVVLKVEAFERVA